MSLSCKRSEYEARYANMDEKKRKRMESNRESAKRSRLKREQRVKDLVNEIATMKEEIFELNGQYNDRSTEAHQPATEHISTVLPDKIQHFAQCQIDPNFSKSILVLLRKKKCNKLALTYDPRTYIVLPMTLRLFN